MPLTLHLGFWLAASERYCAVPLRSAASRRSELLVTGFQVGELEVVH